MSNNRTVTITSLVVLLLIVCVVGFSRMLPTTPVPSHSSVLGVSTVSPTPPAEAVQMGTRTKTSGCQVQGTSQDMACTPGGVFVDGTVQQICTSGYSSQVRDVPESEKNQVYAEYGITSHGKGEYEVDHLISLELGGSNDIANLWPEAAEPKPGFHEKDKVENYLHAQVCNGKISLSEAQQEIVVDWVGVYQRLNHN